MAYLSWFVSLSRTVRDPINDFIILCPVHPQTMVRPRIGDFLYSEDELDVMLRDIRIFKKYGVRGIVVGILTSDGRVDTERLKRLGSSFTRSFLLLNALCNRIVDEALPLEGNFLLDKSMDNHMFNAPTMNQFAFIAHSI